MTLSAEQVSQFQTQGYVVAHGLLDPSVDLQPVVDEYDALVDHLATIWHRADVVKDRHLGVPFGDRVAALIIEGAPIAQHLNISLPINDIRPDTPIHLGPAVFGLLRSERLLDALESLIGPEITASPVQMIRLKVPEHLLPQSARTNVTSTVDWHQDASALLPDADESRIVSVWIPMTQAAVENGCLELVPKSHDDGLAEHCPGDASGSRTIFLHLPEVLVPTERAIPIPMKPGDVLLFSRTLMHRSLPNTSNALRWSFDLRYLPTGEPTGRPMFPSSIVRSRSSPQDEVVDVEAWAAAWREARSSLARAAQERDLGLFTRFPGDSEVCA